MVFLILGIITLLSGIQLLRMARKSNDEEGVTGSIALIIAGVILIVLFGIFYQTAIRIGT